MATLPTPEENARTVLSIFSQVNSRPGHALQAHTFVSFAANNSVPLSDIEDGLQYGISQGWFEKLSTGAIRLTDAGFAEM